MVYSVYHNNENTLLKRVKCFIRIVRRKRFSQELGSARMQFLYTECYSYAIFLGYQGKQKIAQLIVLATFKECEKQK